MASTVLIRSTELLGSSRNGSRRTRLKFRKAVVSMNMWMDFKSSNANMKEELSVHITKPSVHPVETSKSADLQFDRLQSPEVEVNQGNRMEFGPFVAREAVLDEEYWTAAWLRAESHWEGRSGERYVDNYKRKFSEQEFNAIKKRCKGQHGVKCSCIVMVKKEDRNIKRSVLKSVVGTLDLNIRYLLHGETFPGEKMNPPLFCSINRTSPNRYVYIANLCVAKSARRQGIAKNMLHFAITTAISNEITQVYVHVHKNNMPAQRLYQKTGFKMVEMAGCEVVEDGNYLLQLNAFILLFYSKSNATDRAENRSTLE